MTTTRYMVDANVVLLSCFVEDSTAHRLLQNLSASGDSHLYVDEATWQELIKVLEQKRRSLRLTIDPISILNEHMKTLRLLHCPPGVIDSSLDSINRADRAVAAAAREFNAVLLTNDYNLFYCAKQCGINSKIVLQLASQYGIYGTPRYARKAYRNFLQNRGGHYFFRGFLNHPISVEDKRHTALYHGNHVWIYYESMSRRFCACLLHFDRNIELDLEAKHQETIVIALSYKMHNESRVRFGLRVAVGDDQKATRLIAVGQQAVPDASNDIKIANSPNGGHGWRGGIYQIATGPGEITRVAWRALISEHGLIPDNYDRGIVDRALEFINERGT